MKEPAPENDDGSGDGREEDGLGKRLDALEHRVDHLAAAVEDLRDAIGHHPEDLPREESTNRRDLTRSIPEDSPDVSAGRTGQRAASHPPASPSASAPDIDAPNPSNPASSSWTDGIPGGAGGWLRRMLGGTTEDWLSRLGVGLLLFGVAFLFRYAVDQNWMGPVVRVGFGALLGAVLLGSGIRLSGRRRRYSQVLIGGGIATLYLTIFSSYQLYDLVGYLVAFTAMVAVTISAFVLSLQQKQAVLALIGVLGGYATPFLLTRGDGSVPALVIYGIVILALSLGVFWRRGWVMLLYTSIGGVWLTMGTAWVGASESVRVDLVSAQIGLLMAWATAAVVPVLYERARMLHTEGRDASRSLWRRSGVLSSALSAPLLLLTLSRGLWTWSSEAWGVLALVVAGAYAAAAVGLRRMPLRLEASAHAVIASVTLTYALSILFEGTTLYLTLAAQGAALFELAHRSRERSLRWVGHLVFLLVTGLVVGSLLLEDQLSIATWVPPLLVVGLVAYASLRTPRASVRSVYQLNANALLALWAWALLTELTSVISWVQVVWLLQGGGVVFLARRYGNGSPLHLAGEGQRLASIGHGVVALASVSLARRLSLPLPTALDVPTLIPDVLTLALLVAVGLRYAHGLWLQRAYPLGTLLLYLGWTYHTFAGLDGGQGLVSTAWGAVALGLVGVGGKASRPEVLYAGMATLLLVVGKLFLVDLAALSPLWRVLIFLGFGAALLLAGYVLPGRLDPSPSDAPKAEDPPA